MRLRYTLHTRGRSHKYLPAEEQQQHLKHYWTRTSEQDSRERQRDFQFADASATICLISLAVPAVQPVNADQICVFYLSIFFGIFCCFCFFFLVKSLQSFQWARLLFFTKRSIRNDFDIYSFDLESNMTYHLNRNNFLMILIIQ